MIINVGGSNSSNEMSPIKVLEVGKDDALTLYSSTSSTKTYYKKIEIDLQVASAKKIVVYDNAGLSLLSNLTSWQNREMTSDSDADTACHRCMFEYSQDGSNRRMINKFVAKSSGESIWTMQEKHMPLFTEYDPGYNNNPSRFAYCSASGNTRSFYAGQMIFGQMALITSTTHSGASWWACNPDITDGVFSFDVFSKRNTADTEHLNVDFNWKIYVY